MRNSIVNTIRTRLLFNCHSRRCCIVTSVTVHVNLLRLELAETSHILLQLVFNRNDSVCYSAALHVIDEQAEW